MRKSCKNMNINKHINWKFKKHLFCNWILFCSIRKQNPKKFSLVYLNWLNWLNFIFHDYLVKTKFPLVQFYSYSIQAFFSGLFFIRNMNIIAAIYKRTEDKNMPQTHSIKTVAFPTEIVFTWLAKWC